MVRERKRETYIGKTHELSTRGKKTTVDVMCYGIEWIFLYMKFHSSHLLPLSRYT